MPRKKEPNELDRLMQTLLLQRAERRFDAGRYDSTAALLRAVQIDFPGNREASVRLARVYRTLAFVRLGRRDARGAAALARKALEQEPENPEAEGLVRSLASAGDDAAKGFTAFLRHTAGTFLDRFDPGQSELFDLAWRVFQGVTPDAMADPDMAGTLAAAGADEAARTAAHVAVMVSAVDRDESESLSRERVERIIRRAGQRMGADPKMAGRLAGHLAAFFPSHRNLP